MMDVLSPPVATTAYPLIFTYRDLVFGRGFLAGVSVRGRALAVQEPEGVWMYGVNPGGLAESGANRDAAHEAFRQAFTLVLFDLAAGAPNFDAFTQAVRQFIEETNVPTEADWRAAVHAVRAGRVICKGLAHLPADTPLSVSVVDLSHEEFTPTKNEPDALEPALAA